MTNPAATQDKEIDCLSPEAQRLAEARLAAKRAARAEARDIRMKELERQQKEVRRARGSSSVSLEPTAWASACVSVTVCPAAQGQLLPDDGNLYVLAIAVRSCNMGVGHRDETSGRLSVPRGSPAEPTGTKGPEEVAHSGCRAAGGVTEPLAESLQGPAPAQRGPAQRGPPSGVWRLLRIGGFA
ncbi:Leucine-rich repeat flightless-interacting protein 1 [Pteropus alecto]|uniref:Leucine-rich repeat flightless-interacting protein 1 n=1 Tax=Pteropus alecto TaxID=9402 RepID=L5KSK2_PTEAL|nr:Leucine-rich repeat flightless-interacting protein 1 [Pteropus alecto]